MVEYRGAKAAGGEIILVLAFVVGAVIVLYMLAKREITGIGSDIAKAIPKIEIPKIDLFGKPPETESQQIQRTLEPYNISYFDFTPAQKAEYQTNLGETKAQYELTQSPMTWSTFQNAIGSHAQTGGYGAGFDGITTITRDKVPADYTGTYWAGKKII